MGEICVLWQFGYPYIGLICNYIIRNCVNGVTEVTQDMKEVTEQ